MSEGTDRSGMRAAEVVRIADLAGYQAGAVVSREVVRKPSGTVTVFAFDDGQGLTEHTTPYDALVQVLEGEVEITIAGSPHRVHAGESMLMPGGQPHALHAVHRFKMILTMIRS